MAIPSISQQTSSSDAPNRVREVAKDFEAVFLTQMFNIMFKGIATEGLMKGGAGEKVFRGMLIDEFGKIIAKSGSFGVAEAIEGQLTKIINNQNGEQALSVYQNQLQAMQADMLRENAPKDMDIGKVI